MSFPKLKLGMSSKLNTTSPRSPAAPQVADAWLEVGMVDVGAVDVTLAAVAVGPAVELRFKLAVVTGRVVRVASVVSEEVVLVNSTKDDEAAPVVVPTLKTVLEAVELLRPVVTDVKSVVRSVAEVGSTVALSSDPESVLTLPDGPPVTGGATVVVAASVDKRVGGIVEDVVVVSRPEGAAVPLRGAILVVTTGVDKTVEAGAVVSSSEEAAVPLSGATPDVKISAVEIDVGMGATVLLSAVGSVVSEKVGS